MSMLDWFRGPEKTQQMPKRKTKRVRRFDAGVSNSLVAWVRGVIASGINEDLKTDLSTMRERSRDMSQNEPMARKYMRLLAANIIGSKGIILQSQILEDIARPGTEPRPDKPASDAVEDAWRRFNKVGVMDASGVQSGKSFCGTILKTVARDGYSLIIENVNANNEFGYSLSHIDGSRIATDINRPRTDTQNAVIMGVEIDNDGRRVAYLIRDLDFGDGTSKRPAPRRVPAENVIYLADFEYPEQIHGFPWMHASMTRMRTLKKYQEAALTASAVGALKMGFYTQDPDSMAGDNPSLSDDEDEQGRPIQNAEAAHFEVLEPGMDFRSFDPDYPHAMYDAFVKACKRDISSGLDVSYHSLANDLEGVNFSSIRSGTLEEREQYKMVQEWFIEHFLERVFDRWLSMALLRGAIVHPFTGSALPAAKREKFSRHKFIGRRWEWVDPLKDEQANELALKNGMDSPYRILTQKGLDPDEVLDDLQKFQQAAEAKGINPAYIAGVMGAAQQPTNGGGNNADQPTANS